MDYIYPIYLLIRLFLLLIFIFYLNIDHFMGNRRENSGNSVRLYFWGLQAEIPRVRDQFRQKFWDKVLGVESTTQEPEQF